MRCQLLILLIAFMPVPAKAAVTISEVAWMGGITSANHEWIELHNSGEAAVSLEGWTLTDGNNLTIALAGSLAAGRFAVLERTTDDSALGPAFLIYSGALVNSGATLRLFDLSGVLVDQVAGGSDWSGIGGDNVTKETAQYTTTGWITAPATPGASNATKATVAPTSPVVSGGSGKVAEPEVRPAIVLSREPKHVPTLDLMVPDNLYVGQASDFSAVMVGVGEQLAPSTKYTWNFGDTYTADGKAVTHIYEYPGTYVVTVTAHVAGRTAYAERTVVALPITVSLARNEAADIQIHNNAVYTVDLSGYSVRGNRGLTLPQGTRLAPRGTITIASQRLEDVPGQSLVLLFDTAHEPMAQILPSVLRQTESVPPSVVVHSVPSQSLPTASLLPMAVSEFTRPATVEQSAIAEVAWPQVATSSTKAEVRSQQRYYLGLLLLLLGILIAVWTIPRKDMKSEPFELQK